MLRAIALVATLALAVPAAGATFNARFRVEEKPLKAAPAGTVLTFAVYREAGCAAEDLVGEIPVPIENVEALARLSLRRVKGAAKPPKTVELQTRIGGVDLGPTTYLSVTGTGIVPAGGHTCQLQDPGIGGAWPYVAIDGAGTIDDISPSLEGAIEVTKPNGNPAGVYCVAFVGQGSTTSTGAVGQMNSGPAFLVVGAGSTCSSQGRGLQVDVYSIVGGVPTLANGNFTLLFPVYVSPTNP